MAKAFDIVMDSRKELVNQMIEMMEKGYVFTTPEWNDAALRPYNPISDAVYHGGNRLRLMNAAAILKYTDNRWMTAKQLAKAGYKRKEGARGVLCEKWIFEKETKVENPDGTIEIITEELEHPKVAFFTVYNASQVIDFPELKEPPFIAGEAAELADRMIEVSECPVREMIQDQAFYRPASDEIILPPRAYFKDDVSFCKTLLHEMSHSTGHKTRLNRDLSGGFGSESYAREELRAEIGALFTEADLGVHLEAEHYQDHSNYLHSWINVLKNDPNELFRACADAEKISQRLMGNYQELYYVAKPETLEKKPEQEVHRMQHKKHR